MGVSDGEFKLGSEPDFLEHKLIKAVEADRVLGSFTVSD